MSHSISSPIHMPILSTWNSFGKLIAFYILIESGGFLNTSYLTDSYIVFTLKMECLPKITILGLKMMLTSGLEKVFSTFLHAEAIFLYFILLSKFEENHKFSNKNNHLLAWRDFKIIFSRPLFNIIFRPKIVFLDTDSILKVKTMYESVK